ncbi:MAG: hypothetical protein IJ640_07215 [Prevotella sp.]|nr:hypothetical protein [Prevotella sp.]
MAKIKLKDVKRKKFTEKQMELLEKCNYLHYLSMKGVLSPTAAAEYFDTGLQDIHEELRDRIDKMLG